MCDHQAGSACFVGHRWGRGCRDAAQNLLQTSTIDLGGFPLRRICGTERSTTFFFNSSERVVSGWGQSVVGWGRGRGAGGGKKKTQTNKQKPGQRVKTANPSWQALFFFVLTRGVNWKTQTMAACAQAHVILKAPRSVARCATFTTSMRNNQSGHFDRKLHTKRLQTQRKKTPSFNANNVYPNEIVAPQCSHSVQKIYMYPKILLCSHELRN